METGKICRTVPPPNGTAYQGRLEILGTPAKICGSITAPSSGEAYQLRLRNAGGITVLFLSPLHQFVCCVCALQAVQPTCFSSTDLFSQKTGKWLEPTISCATSLDHNSEDIQIWIWVLSLNPVSTCIIMLFKPSDWGQLSSCGFCYLLALEAGVPSTSLRPIRVCEPADICVELPRVP